MKHVLITIIIEKANSNRTQRNSQQHPNREDEKKISVKLMGMEVEHCAVECYCYY